ncbi:RNA recognition motif domain-containing protein [Mariniblastus sp.]|nr:RNA recognition motif domain-containing protein [Mariniblastus sp.]
MNSSAQTLAHLLNLTRIEWLCCLRRVVVAATLVVALVSLTGCQPSEDPMLALMDVDLMKTRVDDLSKTVNLVVSERRFDQREFEDNVSSGLNRWTSYSEDELSDSDWVLDPFAEPVVDQFASLVAADEVGELNFGNTDAWYLQQSYWLRTVANRVIASNDVAPFELYRLAAGMEVSQDSERPVEKIVGALHSDLDEAQVDKLTKSLKVFDWVVRNVQLLPADDPADSEDQALNDSDAGPAAAGIKGLGYQRYPWQTLLYGRGDYVERASLFVLLLRQLEIDAAVLAVSGDEQDASEGSSPTPWAAAVKIGSELYLFDTRMGLPIPGKKPGQIATLSDVRSDASLLKSLDLTVEESLDDDTEYWVDQDDVKELTALIYLSPEEISKRMAALEARLIGDDRLLLVSKPGQIASEFKMENVQPEPWGVAFETHQFRQAVRDAIARSSFDDDLASRLRWHFSDEAYIDQFTRYRTSRARFFAGSFDLQERGYNAIESFQHLMYRDDLIDELGADQKLQRQLGILKTEGQSAGEYQAKLSSVQSQMRLVRRDAGFFLAQTHFDNGSISTAANWLERLRLKDDAKRWAEGIEYLLGRAYEGRTDYNSAIEVYRESEGPQKHGNLIRARLVKQLIDQL